MQYLVGAFTLDVINHFTVNIAFLSASGFSESGVTVADVEEAKLKAAIIERARRTILAIDHEKVGASILPVCVTWKRSTHS